MDSKSLDSWQRRWQSYAFFSVSCLAVAVSMGVALVSFSKALVLVAVIGQMVLDAKNKTWPAWREWPLTAMAIVLAFAWMALSWFWTEAPLADAKSHLSKHSRILWFLAVFYVIRDLNLATRVLKWQVAGLVFLLAGSWMLWLGIPVPWATAEYEPSMGIVSASTLEQPVFLTILVGFLWLFKSHWPTGRWRWTPWAIILLAVTNIFFIMTGRTGFLVMLVLLGMVVYWALPKRWKWGFVVVPLVFAALVYAVSPRFQQRSAEVLSDIQGYQQGNLESSQATRIDYWHRSVLAVIEKPLFGHGVGSWRVNYHRFGGYQIAAPSNPHQAYLLWAVEAGLIGLVLFLGIFVALYQDSLHLSTEAERFSLVILAIAAVMGLMNCPFLGAAVGECFMLMWACLFRMHQTRNADSAAS